MNLSNQIIADAADHDHGRDGLHDKYWQLGPHTPGEVARDLPLVPDRWRPPYGTRAAFETPAQGIGRIERVTPITPFAHIKQGRKEDKRSTGRRGVTASEATARKLLRTAIR